MTKKPKSKVEADLFSHFCKNCNKETIHSAYNEKKWSKLFCLKCGFIHNRCYFEEDIAKLKIYKKNES